MCTSAAAPRDGPAVHDANEPFWRSAKPSSSPIAPALRRLHRRALPGRGRVARAPALDARPDTTGGHPYATQELGYFLWELTP